MRWFFATLIFFCVSSADAHARYHHYAHHRMSAGAQLLSAGLLHQLDSVQWASQPNADNMGTPIATVAIEQTRMVGARGVAVHRWHEDGGSGLSAPCREARREGGPCGCHTAETLLGTSQHVYHGINVWLANGWLAFRHVAPAPGMAAVWPGRHVAPIVAVDGNTVTVADYFGTRTVRMAGLVFVDPRSR